MTDLIARALTGSPDSPALTFRRTYAAGIDDVRDAFTSPDRLARWFGEIDGDPKRVGDPYTARLSDEPDDVAQGRVLACEPGLVSVTWAWQGEPGGVITARFHAVGDRTEVILTHALAGSEHVVGYGGGWEQALESLARTVAGSPSNPDDDTELEQAAVERWRTITRRPLTVSQDIAAPVPEVYAAWTSASGLATWWWVQWPDTRIEADVRPGGSYRIEAPSAGIDLSGTYLAVEPERRLAFTWQWRDGEGESRDEAVDVRFFPEAGGTRVVVRHTGPWEDDEPVESYRQGWVDTLASLGERWA